MNMMFDDICDENILEVSRGGKCKMLRISKSSLGGLCWGGCGKNISSSMPVRPCLKKKKEKKRISKCL
jgi:hypothetical protein